MKSYILFAVSIFLILFTVNVSPWRAVLCSATGAVAAIFFSHAGLIWLTEHPVGHPCLNLVLAAIIFTVIAIAILVI